MVLSYGPKAVNNGPFMHTYESVRSHTADRTGRRLLAWGTLTVDRGVTDVVGEDDISG
jgi:hypothetical protein